MKFSVPLLLNSNYEVTGIFSLHTSLGQVVIIFTNPLKLQKFMDPASQMTARNGQKVGFVEMEGDSISDVVQQLLETDPSMAGQVNFLPDNDPLSDELIASMDQLQGDE